MKQLYRFVLLFVLSLSPLLAQEPAASLNMTLFDRLNPVDSVGLHAALWGYVAPNGREYALFGSQIGTHIIDVTEKPIREVAYIQGPRNPWREMKVYRNYAYIVSEASGEGSGLQIVDLTNLPASANLVRTDTMNFKSAHTIYIRDHYMYVMGTRAEAGANGGAIIFDLEPDPLHPRRIGAVNPYYYHDAWVRNDTLLGAAINGPGCDIYDVRDKANPKHLTTISYPFSGTHNAEITSDGGYVVTSDEVGFTPKTMKVWDIRNLDNITKVAEFSPDPNSIVHNVHVVGRYVFAAWYTAGVRIIDMIDPRHPREVGYYDTYPTPIGGFDGVWEVYGNFPSGKIIASDRNTGLYVMQFNGAPAGSYSGYVRDDATGEPLANITIHLPELGRTITSDAAGFYYVGGANGSQITLATREFRYAGTAETLTLEGDRQKDIRLMPLQFFNGNIVARDESGELLPGFSYALVPHYTSTTVSGASATIALPRDSTYTLIVGKWGYKTESVPITFTAPGQTTTVTLRSGYADNATLDLGWSFQAEEDSAVTGRWTRIVPYQTYSGTGWFSPETQPDGDRNGYIFQTGAPPLQAPPQSGDVNGGYTTLTSPVMDLTRIKAPRVRISFDLWFVHYRADSIRDTLTVQLSNFRGLNWVTAYSEVEGRAGWHRVAFEPVQFLPLTDDMHIRFRTSDVMSNAMVFAAIDNFEVTGTDMNSSVPDERGVELNAERLAIAPNPVRSGGSMTLYVAAPESHLRLELFNSLGQRQMLLHDGALSAGDHSFSVARDLPSGIYMIRATDAGGNTRSAMLQVLR